MESRPSDVIGSCRERLPRFAGQLNSPTLWEYGRFTPKIAGTDHHRRVEREEEERLAKHARVSELVTKRRTWSVRTDSPSGSLPSFPPKLPAIQGTWWLEVVPRRHQDWESRQHLA